MMYKVTTALLVGLMLQACSGNSSSTRAVENSDETSEVSGRVGAATWGARISATPINLEGGPVLIENDSGDLVFDGAASQSEQSGDYTLSPSADDVGGTYIFIANTDNGDVFARCERSDGCGSFSFETYPPVSDDLDIRAGVGELLDGMTVNVNWITDIASSLARTVYIDKVSNELSPDDKADINQAVLEQIESAETGIYNEYTIELANLHVSELFGLSDVISAPVVAPSQITQVTSVSGDAYVEGVYYGALIAALPKLADDTSSDYMTTLELITEYARDARGQLLQREGENNSEEIITKYEIFNAAASLLRGNINYFGGQGATIPSGARTALERLEAVAASMVVDQHTSVTVDVPAELASWGTAIERSKYFIEDLTAAVKNFWGYDDSQPSFVDPIHGRRVDAYYLAHESTLSTLSELTFGPNGVFQDIMQGAEVLARCDYGEGVCSGDGNYQIETDTSDALGRPSDRVLINGSLRVVMRPVETEDSEDDLYRVFDFELESNPDATAEDDSNGFKNSLATGNGQRYYWFTEALSDGSLTTRPYVRVFFDELYSSPPEGMFADDADSSHVAPTQIAIVWPLVRVNQNINGAGSGDSGEHQFNILFEANLVGVTDPLVENSPTRYNPVTLVNRSRSTALGERANESEIFVQLRTTNSSTYYPTQKWPAASEFFLGRKDAPSTVAGLVTSLYRDEQVLSNGTVIEYFDEYLSSSEYASRIKVYPYDASSNTTRTESCQVEVAYPSPRVIGDPGTRSELSCDSELILAGDVTLDELLERNFENAVLTRYSVPGNGIYEIDLNDSDIVNNDTYQGFSKGVDYGPFDATFFEDIEMGIDRLSLVATSLLQDPEEEALIPVVLEFALERQIADQFALSMVYGYGAEEAFENIINNLGVVVGGDAQGFAVEFAVSEEQVANAEGGTDIIEVERGAWKVSRSNVAMGGTDQSVLAQISTRTEYTQGTEEEACGVNDRDKLSSAEGCEAVAYLTVRGALVGTIREERENVFVARFVDGTWMIIGD